jgi:hypothetical protein
MLPRFVIALNLEARRARRSLNLAEYVRDRFPVECKIIETGFRGRSITVEMPESFVETLRHEMPFVTVEPANEIQLLDGTHSMS